MASRLAAKLARFSERDRQRRTTVRRPLRASAMETANGSSDTSNMKSNFAVMIS